MFIYTVRNLNIFFWKRANKYARREMHNKCKNLNSNAKHKRIRNSTNFRETEDLFILKYINLFLSVLLV